MRLASLIPWCCPWSLPRGIFSPQFPSNAVSPPQFGNRGIHRRGFADEMQCPTGNTKNEMFTAGDAQCLAPRCPFVHCTIRFVQCLTLRPFFHGSISAVLAPPSKRTAPLSCNRSHRRLTRTVNADKVHKHGARGARGKKKALRAEEQGPRPLAHSAASRHRFARTGNQYTRLDGWPILLPHWKAYWRKNASHYMAAGRSWSHGSHGVECVGVGCNSKRSPELSRRSAGTGSSRCCN